jgi:hypothetical protein
MGLIVSAETCDELAGILGNSLTVAAAAVRRAGLGLIVPPLGAPLPKLNGG